jgi:hypothetical protein
VFIVPATVIASPSQTVYVPDPAPTVQTVSLNSVFIDFGVCSPISLGPTSVIAGVPVIDLSTVFIPPYRLQ